MEIDTLTSLFTESDIMRAVALIFIFNWLILIMETVSDRLRHVQRDWNDSWANLTIHIATQLLEKTFYGSIFFVALLPFYYWLSPIEIPMNALSWILALVIADLSYYWMHRCEHTYRILWANHSVHHSSKDFNLTIALRICLFDSLVEWIFLVPMIIIGFNPFQTIVAFILLVQYQSWIHTDHIGKLKWIEGIFNTPSAHRVHHGSNQKYLDKNYGSVLIIWDRLFGTYQPEEEPVVYGLTENINTNNPIMINIFEYKRIWHDMRSQQSLAKKIKIAFSRLSS